MGTSGKDIFTTLFTSFLTNTGCRHAVNPTCSARLELILKESLDRAGAIDATATSVGVEAAVVGGLADQLVNLKLVPDKEVEVLVSCQCTRKCKTRQCPCKLERVLCNPNCHVSNNDCTNK